MIEFFLIIYQAWLIVLRVLRTQRDSDALITPVCTPLNTNIFWPGVSSFQCTLSPLHKGHCLMLEVGKPAAIYRLQVSHIFRLGPQTMKKEMQKDPARNA